MGVVALGGAAASAIAAGREAAGAALREEHAILGAVTERTTDAVFVKDRLGCYLVINAAGRTASDPA